MNSQAVGWWVNQGKSREEVLEQLEYEKVQMKLDLLNSEMRIAMLEGMLSETTRH